MKLQRIVIIAFLFFSLTACGATSDFMRPTPGMAKMSQSNGKAQIVFVRPSSFAKGILLTIIDSSGNFVGDSQPGSHFAIEVEPGEHVFIGWGEGTHALKANVEGGKTYFVEVAPKMGIWAARFHLLAIKPTTENWADRVEWMAETQTLVVNQAAGQQYHIRGDRANDPLSKGMEQLNSYNAEELDDRTLSPSDGL